MPCAVLMLALTAGCTSTDDTPIDQSASTPLIAVPTTPESLEPAIDCSKSDVPLEPETVVEGVELTITTDPSHTSMLVKNTGSLSVLVIPDAKFASRLLAAPHANPTDQASRAALIAVNSSGILRTIRGMPPYLPKSQIVVLPPQWAVCALTDNLDQAAGVRYLRDEASSAEYFMAKGLADQLAAGVDTTQARRGLIRCARDALILVTTRPDLTDIELYAEALSAKMSCRDRLKGLLNNDEHTTQQVSTSILNELERAPRLLPNTKLYDVLSG